jgi:predicted O-methyltransferase YrrM
MNPPDMIIPGLPPFDGSDDVWNMAPEYRREYVNIKYGVAANYKPAHICEIGVYSGIAALCFLAASPRATYLGIDDLSAEQNRGLAVVEQAAALLTGLNYNAHVVHVDSQMLEALPGEFDFVHVDGNHARLATCHDVVLAWKSLTSGGHILIDNGHDTSVCAGTFDAMRLLNLGLLNWSYLSEGVGSILIERLR